MKEPDSLGESANSPAIMIDDLGEDAKEAVLFGNVLTPMIDLFEHRYEWRPFTIATTNLPPSELLAKYDERVASRLKEMMLVLKFTGHDWRDWATKCALPLRQILRRCGWRWRKRT